MTEPSHAPESDQPESAVEPRKDQPKESSKATARKKPNLVLWLVLGGIALILLVIIYIYVSTVLPIWWANTIGNQVDKNLVSGALLGLFYGFVFTIIPLIIVWQARRNKVRWPYKIILLVIGVILAGPNLITLGIYTASTETAHNAQRILGTEATWFGTWTAWGAIIAAIVFVGSVIAAWQYKRRGQKMKKLEESRQQAKEK